MVIRVPTMGFRLGRVCKMDYSHEYITELAQDFAENCDAVDKKGYRKLIEALNSGEQMAECVKAWYNTKEREEHTNEDGKTVYTNSYTHATDITNLRTSRTIVNDYYKAYMTALDGAANDADVAYNEIHHALLENLNNYFDNVFLSCLEEQYGEEFIKFYCAKVDKDEAVQAYADAKKAVQGCKQSLSRLEKPKEGRVDFEKVKAAKEKLADAETELAAIKEQYDKCIAAYDELVD